MTLAPLRRRLYEVLRLDDPPWRIALALAVGVFISCTPFYFLQTVLAILVATVFRLNKAATVAGTWLNLPWFQPLVYAASFKVGALVVSDPSGASAEALHVLLEQPGAFSWDEILDVLGSLSVTLLVGTTIVGVVAAAVTYTIAVRLIGARRSGGHDATGSDRRRAA